MPCAFLPFGNGLRNCVGMRLAYLEAKIGLLEALRELKYSRDVKTEVSAHRQILAVHRFQLSTGFQVPPVLSNKFFSTAPANGCHVRTDPR